jgi:hypothetical protein
MNEEQKVVTIFGRTLDRQDIVFINQLIESEGSLGRSHISRRLCEVWEWRQPNGRYREIACRQLMRRLEQKGLITLPPMLCAARQPGYKNKSTLPKVFDTTHLEKGLNGFQQIIFEMVRGKEREKVYNGFIGSYHYLGYHQGAGEQLKYLVYGDGRLLSCIGFGAAAWKVACRDRFIGWDSRLREKRLNRIVNNHRFLILPWIRVPHLASFILGKVTRRLNEDWRGYYHHDIVLVETFVERERFRGTCYRAANWLHLGQTTGRGRNDRKHRKVTPIKDVYIYPLVKNFRMRLLP